MKDYTWHLEVEDEFISIVWIVSSSMPVMRGVIMSNHVAVVLEFIEAYPTVPLVVLELLTMLKISAFFDG